MDAPGSEAGLPVVGMVGAGQLARMTHQAAIALGQSLRVLAAGPDDPAALVTAGRLPRGADRPRGVAGVRARLRGRHPRPRARAAGAPACAGRRRRHRAPWPGRAAARAGQARDAATARRAGRCRAAVRRDRRAGRPGRVRRRARLAGRCSRPSAAATTGAACGSTPTPELVDELARRGHTADGRAARADAPGAGRAGGPLAVRAGGGVAGGRDRAGATASASRCSPRPRVWPRSPPRPRRSWRCGSPPSSASSGCSRWSCSS